MRAAFDATMKDQEFLADAKTQKAHIDPVSGDEINALLERVYSAPPDVADRLRSIVK